jgi:hypothetical protein
VDNNSVADDAGGVGVHKTGRQQMELESLAVNHDGMARVIASRAARDDIILTTESIHNLAFPLVTPLGAEHYSCAHVFNFAVERGSYFAER